MIGSLNDLEKQALNGKQLKTKNKKQILCLLLRYYILSTGAA